MDKKVEITVMQRAGKPCIVVLNNFMICGSFPSEAHPILETKVPLKDIAMAFSANDLQEMLEFRRTMANPSSK